MSLGRIIRNKRERLGLTLDEVGRRSGFSKPYLSTIETGRVANPPSDELLMKLEQILQFARGELLYIAHMHNLPSDIRDRIEKSETQNKRFRQILKDMVKRNAPAAELAQFLNEIGSDNNVEPLTVVPERPVPIINKVAAGYPTDFDDLDYPVGVADDYIRCPDLHDPSAFAVRVVGNSMEPKFHEGDIVIFSPAAQVHSGDDCFVRFRDPHETTFKRIFFEEDNRIRLQPRNEQFSPLIVEADKINGMYRAVTRFETL